MMGLTETLVFYVVVGLSVAVAVWSRDGDRTLPQRTFHAATAIAFWPLYLPILLTPTSPVVPAPAKPAVPLSDELSNRIAEVELELDAALSSLDGWAEEALSRERERIGELRAAWSSQANRIREMDEILSNCPLPDPLKEETETIDERLHDSERSRRQNVIRLHQVRAQAYEDLTATLARVRELVSLIHLAKFTGAPASRADELVQEIAASVEGLSEVSGWHDRSEEQVETAAQEFRGNHGTHGSHGSEIPCGIL